MSSKTYTITTVKLQGISGSELRCADHGLVGWCRHSLLNALIAAHVRQHHAIKDGVAHEVVEMEK